MTDSEQSHSAGVLFVYKKGKNSSRQPVARQTCFAFTKTPGIRNRGPESGSTVLQPQHLQGSAKACTPTWRPPAKVAGPDAGFPRVKAPTVRTTG
jgi:hypothetical protein